MTEFKSLNELTAAIGASIATKKRYTYADLHNLFVLLIQERKALQQPNQSQETQSNADTSEEETEMEELQTHLQPNWTMNSQ